MNRTVRGYVTGTRGLAIGPALGARHAARGNIIAVFASRAWRPAHHDRRTAHYANGERTLKPTTFDTMSVTITRDMFHE